MFQHLFQNVFHADPSPSAGSDGRHGVGRAGHSTPWAGAGGRVRSRLVRRRLELHSAKKRQEKSKKIRQN